jgi:surface antigen
VLAWGDRQASRRSQYSGAGALRLCWRWRFAGAVAAALCGLPSSGCTYQLHSLLGKDDADGDLTGSISRPGAAGRTADAVPSSEADFVYARAAAADALAKSAKDASVPWQNPSSGAGGNITPLATSYSEGGAPCRDFLASYAHNGVEEWLQGAACRTSAGDWEVKSLKPLKRS